MSVFVEAIRTNYVVRPRRLLIAGVVMYGIMRKKDEITIKGKCPKCGYVFDLPRRTKSPIFVKCPKCGYKTFRVVYIITYLRR